MITPFLFRPALRGVCRRRAETVLLGGKAMTTEQFCIIAAIVIYLLGMVYVGFYFSRKGGGLPTSSTWAGGSWGPSSPP